MPAPNLVDLARKECIKNVRCMCTSWANPLNLLIPYVFADPVQ